MSGAVQGGYRTDLSVEAWLDSRGLGSLAEAFFAAGYQDFLVIQVCNMYTKYKLYTSVLRQVVARSCSSYPKGSECLVDARNWPQYVVVVLGAPKLVMSGANLRGVLGAVYISLPTSV